MSQTRERYRGAVCLRFAHDLTGRPPAADEVAKTTLFDGRETPPTPYPQAFTVDEIPYLLFGRGAGHFWLFALDHEDESHVYYVSAARWDFSAVIAYVNSIPQQPGPHNTESRHRK